MTEQRKERELVKDVFWISGGFYLSADSIVSARSVPLVLAATHVPELRGYSDMDSIGPFYSSNLPVVSGYGASRSGVNYKSFVPI